MYQAPNIQTPSVQEIKDISQHLHLGITESDLKPFHDIVCRIINSNYPKLEKYVEPKLPVKYPRTPGYRPQPEDNKYNAWYHKTDIQGAPDGPLRGKKVVIKDCFPVAGVPMMNGSRVMEGYVPDCDPTVITRVLDAGATIVGKAVCEDLCDSGSSFTSHPFPVKNPHNTEYACGGSSSGCAVLVQIGEADMALGGDQGGSVRIPSSWTGIVGLKATYGLVPFTGLDSVMAALDHCGPMARNVKDCALLLEAIAGDDDGLDMRQRNIPRPENLPKYSELLTGNVTDKKIGIVTEGFDGCDEDVATLVMNAARKLETKGATVDEVSIPIHKDGVALRMPTVMEGWYHTLVEGQGHIVGAPSYYSTSAIDNVFACNSARSRDQPTCVKISQLIGKYVSDNYGLHFYAKSQNLLRLAKQHYDKVLSVYDVLIMPTMKTKAPKLPKPGISVEEVYENSNEMPMNTALFNGTGHPVLSLNVGYSEGLPVGMSIVGKHLEDEKVLNIAYAYEQILGVEEAK